MNLVDINFNRASIFTNTESDYIDEDVKYAKNNFYLEQFFNKLVSNNLTKQDVLEYFSDYSIKAPMDTMKFYFREQSSNEIIEDTLDVFFNPILNDLLLEFPDYSDEIQYIRNKINNDVVSPSDFLRYTLINDPNYIRGSSFIDSKMTDNLINKMHIIREIDHWIYAKRRK